MFDIGLTTFMILASSLVMLMTPGLAFFYGGLGNKNHILSIMMQSFVSMGISSILWFAIGYSLFSVEIWQMDPIFMDFMEISTKYF